MTNDLANMYTARVGKIEAIYDVKIAGKAVIGTCSVIEEGSKWNKSSSHFIKEKE